MNALFPGFEPSSLRHRQEVGGEHTRDRDVIHAEHLRAHLLPLQRGPLQAL